MKLNISPWSKLFCSLIAGDTKEVLGQTLSQVRDTKRKGDVNKVGRVASWKDRWMVGDGSRVCLPFFSDFPFPY